MLANTARLIGLTGPTVEQEDLYLAIEIEVTSHGQ